MDAFDPSWLNHATALFDVLSSISNRDSSTIVTGAPFCNQSDDNKHIQMTKSDAPTPKIAVTCVFVMCMCSNMHT